MKSGAGQRQGEEKSRREKMIEEKESSERRCRGRKAAKHCVFPMVCGSGGSKSRLAKAAGAEPSGQMRDEKVHAVVARSTFRSQNVQNTPGSGPLLEVEMSKKCTPLWREAHFEVKMHKTHQCRTTFGSWDVEKVHAVVARSTFRSQHAQNTPVSDHFWKLRCQKSACRCGAKHISKSKGAKHHMFAPLLEVQMSFRVWVMHALWMLHSRGVGCCMYPVFLMAPTRSEKTHARSLSVCLGGLQATAYSTWRARDAVRKTHNPSRHYYLATGVLLMRWPTVIVTCHSQPTFFMIHTLF